jgi:predicted RND superfamily exporter protein
MHMRSLGRAILKWRFIFLALIAVASAISLLSLANLETREDESTWMADDNPARIEYDRFKQLFGSDRFIVVAYETPDAFCVDEIEYLDYLTTQLSVLPHIREAVSLSTIDETICTSFGTVEREFLRKSDAPCTESERCALDARIAANPFIEGSLISGDREVLGIFLEVESTLSGQTYEEITLALEQTLGRETDTTGREFYCGGGPVYDAKVNAIMARDIAVFVPLTLLVSGIILLFLFRNWRCVVLPLLAVVLSMAWTFGLKAAVGSPVTPVSTALVALIVIIGVANSVHFISHYRLELSRAPSAEHAMVDTFSRAGVPCFLTSITTAVGFSSLVVSNIPLIRHLGAFAGFGIMCTFVLTMVLLPVGLSGARIPHDASEHRSRIWTAVGSFVVEHWRVVIGLCVIFSVLVALGGLRIEVEPSMTEYLKPGSTVRQAADFIDDHLAGSSSVELLLEGPADSFEDVDVLRSIDHLQSAIGNHAYVAASMSPVDFIKSAGDGSIPPNDTAVARAFSLLERSDVDLHEYYVKGDIDSLRVSIRTKQMHIDQRTKLVSDIEGFAERNLAGLDLTVTGAEGLVNGITVDVVRTQIYSVAIAVLVILGLMLLFFGPRGALAAILPNIVPIAMLFGVMGLGGFELNIATITVAAICIGLVVDDTIHYFAHFRRIVLKSGNSQQAAVEALHEVGTALAFTTLTLTLGFCVFTLSQSAFLVQFGFLATTALVVAFVADITVSPAILSHYEIFRPNNGLMSRGE